MKTIHYLTRTAQLALCLLAFCGPSSATAEEFSDSTRLASQETGIESQIRRANAAYESGDFAQAYRLYRNVSVLGASEAHYRLGIMHAEGQGTRKSARQAIYWFKLAASQNYPGAQQALTTAQTTSD
jgi:TPR repeat protein